MQGQVSRGRSTQADSRRILFQNDVLMYSRNSSRNLPGASSDRVVPPQSSEQSVRSPRADECSISHRSASTISSRSSHVVNTRSWSELLAAATKPGDANDSLPDEKRDLALLKRACRPQTKSISPNPAPKNRDYDAVPNKDFFFQEKEIFLREKELLLREKERFLADKELFHREREHFLKERKDFLDLRQLESKRMNRAADDSEREAWRISMPQPGRDRRRTMRDALSGASLPSAIAALTASGQIPPLPPLPSPRSRKPPLPPADVAAAAAAAERQRHNVASLDIVQVPPAGGKEEPAATMGGGRGAASAGAEGTAAAAVERLLREMLRRLGDVEGRLGGCESAMDRLREAMELEEAGRVGARAKLSYASLRKLEDTPGEEEEEEEKASDASPSSTKKSRGSGGLAGFLDRFCGMRQSDRQFGREGSRLVHPHSTFAQGMVLASCLTLVYSAFVVPIKLSFWEMENACVLDPSVFFDVVVDLYFLVEIIVTFFTGIYLPGGVYVDDWRAVAWHYFASPTRFWFDFSTSIPFNIIDVSIAQSCVDGIPTGTFATTNTFQYLRVFKVFRIIRLFKFVRSIRLLQTLKSFNVTAMAKDELSYLAGPTVIKLTTVMLTLAFFVHIFACFFWRIKLNSSSAEEVEIFLTSRNIAMDDQTNIYMVCFYFVFTVFSTVGFGDIFPVTFSERVLIAFMFVCGSVFFGYIMAQLNEILQSLNKEEKEIDNFMESYIAFLRQCGAPAETERRILRWVRFYYTEEVAARQKREILSDPKLPDEFRVALAKSLQDNLFHHVPFLVGLLDRIRGEFAAQLLLVGETRYFARDAELGNHKAEAQYLMIVLKGKVEVSLPGSGRVLRILQRGDVFGDSAVVGDLRWAGSWGISANFWARTKCCVMVFSLEKIEELLHRIEFSLIKRRIERGRVFWDENVAESQHVTRQSSLTCKPDYKPEAVFFWISTTRRLLADSAAVSMKGSLADAALVAGKLRHTNSNMSRVSS